MTPPPSIYSFFCYREYLQEWFCWKKLTSHRYSHRVFSREAGITSPNYLHRVLTGTRNLSEDYSERFSGAIGHSRHEAAYLILMIHYAHAESSTEKTAWLRKMMRARSVRGMESLTKTRLGLFEKWFYPIIRELACILPDTNDCLALGKACIPAISEAEAREALDYLRNDGFLSLSESGGGRQSDPGISTGDEVNSLMVRAFNQQILSQTVDLIDTIPRSDREVSSTTLGVSLKTYKRMRDEVRQFRKHLIEMALADEGSELVCMVSMQLMPRSILPVTGEKDEHNE